MKASRRGQGQSEDTMSCGSKRLKTFYEAGISFHVAAMTGSRIMQEGESREIINRLSEIDEGIAKKLEEEIIDPYNATLFKLKQAE